MPFLPLRTGMIISYIKGVHETKILILPEVPEVSVSSECPENTQFRPMYPFKEDFLSSNKHNNTPIHQASIQGNFRSDLSSFLFQAAATGEKK